MGYLDNRDWKTYSDLFLNMTKFLKSPDIIIYLRADLDVLLERINNRNRDYEATIDPEYLKRLNVMYDEWIESISWTKVLTVDTNTFNIFEDKDTLESIYKDIKEKLK